MTTTWHLILSLIALFIFSSDSIKHAQRPTKLSSEFNSKLPTSIQQSYNKEINKNSGIINKLLLSSLFVGSTLSNSKVLAIDQPTISRNDVGFINLNETMPKITDITYFDIQAGTSDPQRIEISLFGDIVPLTVQNFKALCLNKPGYGYKNSNIFRIISQFSVQGGNIPPDGTTTPLPQSKMGRYGRAALTPFPPENYRILHSYKDAGMVFFPPFFPFLNRLIVNNGHNIYVQV